MLFVGRYKKGVFAIEIFANTPNIIYPSNRPGA